MNRKTAYSLALAALVAVATPALAGRESMIILQRQEFSPERVYTEAQVREAIMYAAGQRRWVVSGDEPGKITLRYAPRSHVVVVEVPYDAKGFTVKYVSSENLGYELRRGKTIIHDNYNDWQANLVNGIKNAPVLWAPAKS